MKRKTIYRMKIYLGASIFYVSTDLTEKQFIQIKGQLESQYASIEDPKELGVEYTRKEVKDNRLERRTVWIFSYGDNEVYLFKFEAKKGYCFK